MAAVHGSAEDASLAATLATFVSPSPFTTYTLVDAHPVTVAGVSRAATRRRSVWEPVEGESEDCECADIDGGREWEVVCLGLYSGRRSQVVRSPLPPLFTPLSSSSFLTLNVRAVVCF